MSTRRILLVGQGRVGREVFAEYRDADADVTLMVHDPNVPSPQGYEWDKEPVDLAVVMVDTPADSQLSGRFDYSQLVPAVEESLAVADHVVIRSTVSLDFLEQPVYTRHLDKIGFCPEFYGTTAHSARGSIDLGFVIMSTGVPQWFFDFVSGLGVNVLYAPADEVIVAKLTENAFLAVKVTFFHELYLTCQRLGLSFALVRTLVTMDPRIVPYHSYVDSEPGWSSHCWDKDLPVFAGLGPNTKLVRWAMNINEHMLARRRNTSL